MIAAKRILGTFGVSVLIWTSGCGGGPTAPSTFSQTLNGSVNSFGISSHTVSTPRAGTATVVLTWSSSAVDLDLYITPTSCTGADPSSCRYTTYSASGSGTREQVTFGVVAGESFKVWIDSYASGTQTYSVSVMVQ